MRRSAPYYVVRGAISPSENESYSRVIMEAWLSGRPAAADTNCLARRPQSRTAEGARSQFDEWISLFATIEDASDAELAAIGQKGREYAEKVASWDAAIGRYEAAIADSKKTLCENRSRSAVVGKISVHQILPNVAIGDAISNHALWIRELCANWVIRRDLCPCD